MPPILSVLDSFLHRFSCFFPAWRGTIFYRSFEGFRNRPKVGDPGLNEALRHRRRRRLIIDLMA